MDQQTITAAIGIGIIGVLVLIGLLTIAREYLINLTGAYVLPALASLVVAAVFVVGLSIVGSRSERWLHGPYW